LLDSKALFTPARQEREPIELLALAMLWETFHKLGRVADVNDLVVIKQEVNGWAVVQSGSDRRRKSTFYASREVVSLECFRPIGPASFKVLVPIVLSDELPAITPRNRQLTGEDLTLDRPGAATSLGGALLDGEQSVHLC
jgi:hypothetical protein